MRSLLILTIAGLAAAQLQVQISPHQQRPPVQIQTPTIHLPPRAPNFDEQWQEPQAPVPEWLRNNPLWQNEGPQPIQPIQPLPEWLMPEPEWQARPDRPVRPVPDNQWNFQPEPQPQPDWRFQPQPQPDWHFQPQPQPEWNMRPQPRPDWNQPRQPVFPMNTWRPGQPDPRCPNPDDHTGNAFFLAGPTQNTFFICWGGVAWPFTCPGNSVWRTEVNACADPGWTPEFGRGPWNNNNNNQWNQWQPIRPFVDEQHEEKPEPY